MLRFILVLLLNVLPLWRGFDLHAEGHAQRGKTCNLAQELEKILTRKVAGEKIAISVADIEREKEIYGRNADEPVKPASVLKILTSLVALRDLGPEYRFKTQFWGEGVRNNTIDALYIQGSGDPSLTIESLWLAIRALYKLGVRKVRHVYLDDTRFAYSTEPTGQRAFQTGSSALAFNFNSITFEVCPSAVGKKAVVIGDPWEVNPSIVGEIKTVIKGPGVFSIDEGHFSDGHEFTYRVSGSIGISRGCTSVYRSVRQPLNYFGRTFLKLLEKERINAPASFELKRIPSGATLLFEHESKPLREILEDLNHFSNNFIGEQLLYAIGASTEGALSRDNGLKRMSDFLKELGFREDEFRLDDGSGLSHNNRVSAKIITRLLMEGVSDERYRVEFENSLSVAGRNGTLKSRPPKDLAMVMRGKTGTLDGVTTLAGILSTKGRKKVAFSILQNNVRSRDAALELNNQVADLIYRCE